MSCETSRLKALAVAAGLPAPETEVVVSGLSFDSRRVNPGDLYLALPGARAHGANFASQAAANGAVAILTDSEGAELAADTALPVLVAAEPRRAMASVAVAFYGRPAESLRTFAVTGTNGKTTSVYILSAALSAAGATVGSIGTNGFQLAGRELRQDRTTVTTPESPDLQALLAQMLAGGATDLAMEVSSHALAFDRVYGVRFDVAGFTNLGRDHLDFHPSLDHYKAAKAKLFEQCDRAVLNAADPVGVEFAAKARQLGLAVRTYGAGGDYRVISAEPQALGWRVRLATPDGEVGFALSLPGEYNLANACLCVGMLDIAGVDLTSALGGLNNVRIPGRVEQVDIDSPFEVIVDFAHTPQAISAVLEALRPRAKRLICVLGAGGDRDPDKRELMGSAAGSVADCVIVTDDNPRTEPPAAIRRAVRAGAEHSCDDVREVSGRQDAILHAIETAGSGDVVAVLGKGHEKGQILSDRIVDFDDVLAAKMAWSQLNGDSHAAD